MSGIKKDQKLLRALRAALKKSKNKTKTIGVEVARKIKRDYYDDGNNGVHTAKEKATLESMQDHMTPAAFKLFFPRRKLPSQKKNKKTRGKKTTKGKKKTTKGKKKTRSREEKGECEPTPDGFRNSKTGQFCAMLAAAKAGQKKKKASPRIRRDQGMMKSVRDNMTKDGSKVTKKGAVALVAAVLDGENMTLSEEHTWALLVHSGEYNFTKAARDYLDQFKIVPRS